MSAGTAASATSTPMTIAAAICFVIVFLREVVRTFRSAVGTLSDSVYPVLRVCFPERPRRPSLRSVFAEDEVPDESSHPLLARFCVPARNRLLHRLNRRTV